MFSYFEISTVMGTLRRTDQDCSSERYKVPFSRTTSVVDRIEYASVYPFQWTSQNS